VTPFVRVAPWIFVVLWSTGFIVARYATNDAGPLTFLAIRTIVAAMILVVIARATRAPRLSRSALLPASLAGLGMHAVYLGGVFIAIDMGLPSGLGALIAGLHPVVTSLLGRLVLRERLTSLQWLGVALGFLGVIAVVVEKMGDASATVPAGALVAMACAVAGMSAGTLVQRASGREMPLLSGTATQYAAAGVAFTVVAIPREGFAFELTQQFVLALAWATLVLSLAAVLIMMKLLSTHTAAGVSSLFFLTPALSTVEGAILFGERMGPFALAGLAIAGIGVMLTMRQGAATTVSPVD
jgi:drug/metabolite transporter (DMT)-like permease